MKKEKMLKKMIKVKFEYCLEIPDFKIMNDLVNWCDVYTRNRILTFHFMKHTTNYLVKLERDKDFPERIKSLFIFVRYINTHKDNSEKNINEFLDFIKNKFKKARPTIFLIQGLSKAIIKKYGSFENAVSKLSETGKIYKNE